MPERGNKRKAMEILEQRKREYDEHGLTALLAMDDRAATNSMLFSTFMLKWVKTKKPSLRETTYNGYVNSIEGRIKEFFDSRGVTLNGLQPQHIEDFYETLIDAGLKGTSLIHYHQVMRQALDYAVRKDYLDKSPMLKVDRPKKNKFHAAFYTAEEVTQMLECAKDDLFYIPILITAYYGLRRSEVLGLQWDSIDFAGHKITVKRTAHVRNVNGKTVVKLTEDMKTETSRRTLPMIPFVEQELLAERERQARNKKAFGKAYNKSRNTCVCVDGLGDVLNPNALTCHWPHFLEKHGLRKIRFHDLRHTCASLLVGAGVSMKQVQLWLGHSTFSTTADIYAHLDYKAMEAPAQTVAGILG